MTHENQEVVEHVALVRQDGQLNGVVEYVATDSQSTAYGFRTSISVTADSSEA